MKQQIASGYNMPRPGIIIRRDRRMAVAAVDEHQAQRGGPHACGDVGWTDDGDDAVGEIGGLEGFSEVMPGMMNG